MSVPSRDPASDPFTEDRLMNYYVSRCRFGWVPGQPHPGLDEWDEKGPTGRLLRPEARFPYNESDFFTDAEAAALRKAEPRA
jgi:hypothetical protein